MGLISVRSLASLANESLKRPLRVFGVSFADELGSHALAADSFTGALMEQSGSYMFSIGDSSDRAAHHRGQQTISAGSFEGFDQEALLMSLVISAPDIVIVFGCIHGSGVPVGSTPAILDEVYRLFACLHVLAQLQSSSVMQVWKLIHADPPDSVCTIRGWSDRLGKGPPVAMRSADASWVDS